MRIELPAVSFFCLGLVILLSPVWICTRNAAVISLASWLFCCSLIHGINALLWAGNDAVHVPIWCDIGKRACRLFRVFNLLTYRSMDRCGCK